jgi:hypothetical protein
MSSGVAGIEVSNCLNVAISAPAASYTRLICDALSGARSGRWAGSGRNT